MRLIDADVMTDYLGDKFLEVQRAMSVSFEHPRLIEILEMIQWVKEQPTVDAVEVVRCKDCRWYAGEGMYCANNIVVQFDHFFCYYGEREEDE